MKISEIINLVNRLEKVKKGEDILDTKTRLEDKIEGCLSNLEAKGLISYRKTDYLFRINVKSDGFEKGKLLDDKKWRFVMWLKDNIIIFIYLAIIGALVLAALLYTEYLR